MEGLHTTVVQLLLGYKTLDSDLGYGRTSHHSGPITLRLQNFRFRPRLWKDFTPQWSNYSQVTKLQIQTQVMEGLHTTVVQLLLGYKTLDSDLGYGRTSHHSGPITLRLQNFRFRPRLWKDFTPQWSNYSQVTKLQIQTQVMEGLHTTVVQLLLGYKTLDSDLGYGRTSHHSGPITLRLQNFRFRPRLWKDFTPQWSNYSQVTNLQIQTQVMEGLHTTVVQLLLGYKTLDSDLGYGRTSHHSGPITLRLQNFRFRPRLWKDFTPQWSNYSQVTKLQIQTQVMEGLHTTVVQLLLGYKTLDSDLGYGRTSHHSGPITLRLQNFRFRPRLWKDFTPQWSNYSQVTKLQIQTQVMEGLHTTVVQLLLGYKTLDSDLGYGRTSHHSGPITLRLQNFRFRPRLWKDFTPQWSNYSQVTKLQIQTQVMEGLHTTVVQLLLGYKTLDAANLQNYML